MPEPPVRLAELLGGLSLASDLVNGFAHGKVVRTAVLAVLLARELGESPSVQRDTYYASLLRYLGCSGFAHEESAHYGAGDDIAVRNTMALADPDEPWSTLSAIVTRVGAGAGVARRTAAVARLLGDGDAVVRHARSQCEASIALARMVGASDELLDHLRYSCERWDGKGAPHRVLGEATPIAMRIHHLADVAEIAFHRDGREAAIALVRRRSGKQLDPRVAAGFLAHARNILDVLDAPGSWERFLAIEPEPFTIASSARIDGAARALGAFADLKSVFTLGHSAAVADLADAVAVRLGLDPAARRELRRAAWLHDVGRVSVPNSVWDKPGPLDLGERERVRLHAYYTERVLWQAPPLRPAAAIACAAHERLDGGGYHRSLAAPSTPRAARILAVADAVCAMQDTRPHRPRLRPAEIRRELGLEAKLGRLDREVVDAAIDAAGLGAGPGGIHRQERTRPSALSEREVEVLRWVARGKTNKEIGTILGISARTVQNHVAHVYDKTGVASRAGAALYATEHHILHDGASG